ncbi:phage major tail protein, TP901-1 family [Hyphomonas sp.]|uniref:phage major tail protein, TP901-1 family n=1 Tax=Hyphomonas sp. TaxID=87 RepID=UPI00391C22C7
MAGQKGRDILLKISDGPGSFTTVAGIRASRIELASGLVDSTAMDSPDAWRELIGGAGVKTARISGQGVFRDAASDELMRSMFFEGDVCGWQLILPGFGVLEGLFQISALSWSGRHDGEAEFSVTLESAGQLTFEALP